MKNDIEKVLKHFSEKGWKLDSDYDIYTNGIKKGSKINHYLNVAFKAKDNKDEIEYLESEGWFEKQKYKNEDGDPTIWGTNEMGHNLSHSILMIIMSKDLVGDYEQVTNILYVLRKPYETNEL
ncbi:MAG TPA: hypothetical protein DCP90_01930 [Clostridiales bacterium]|nr:MAG: hypothetical protein A2Y22_08725 [Clostridiales bacterium GWD2_32_59]HAN09352.1 hypothetical protein [Clostridiales bacterium]